LPSCIFPLQDNLIKDLMQKESMAQLFTDLANSRISDLNRELVRYLSIFTQPDLQAKS